MNLISKLTNQELVAKTHVLVKEERRLTVEVLRLLRETERRMLFAELGYSSLFAYCTGELGYSEAAASRRIEAMRAMRETAELEPKIESGELSLSIVAQARVAIRSHERETKTKVDAEKKRDVMFSLIGLSKREAEKALVNEFPMAAPIRPVVERATAHGARVTLELTSEEMKVIEELRRLGGVVQNTKDLLLCLARKELSRRKRECGEEKLLRVAKGAARTTPPAEWTASRPEGRQSVRPRPITAKRIFSTAVKRSAWMKAQGQCEFATTGGRRCTARHGLEFDHQKPFALGGASSSENVRLLCRQHNGYEAVRQLGRSKMTLHLTGLA